MDEQANGGLDEQVKNSDRVQNESEIFDKKAKIMSSRPADRSSQPVKH